MTEKHKWSTKHYTQKSKDWFGERKKTEEKESAIMVNKALHKNLENDEHEPYYRKESGELCWTGRVSSFKKERYLSATNST